MRYFDFDSLIDKYTVDFTLLRYEKSRYDDLGELVPDKQEQIEMSGAVMSISDAKIYKSDGVFTAKDKELFLKESLGDISKAFVFYDGSKYHVETNPQNNSQFTGVFQYTLKWVSAFKEGGKLD